jgi:nucleoid DNA-binding protein
MNKLNTLNEKEQRDAVHASLEAKGIKVTKTLVNQIMDTQNDLLFNALASGKGIKVSGLGTLAVVTHQERAYKLPNGTTGTAPAGYHVRFIESDNLLESLNAPVTA